MQPAELEVLQHKISNEARLLYLLLIKPGSSQEDGTSKPLNFKQIRDLLNSGGANITYGREINELIVELIAAGLLEAIGEIDINDSLNGCQFLLPLAKDNSTSDIHHLPHFAMQKSWQPEAKIFAEIAQLVGLIQKEYNEGELGEFIAYWLGRPEQRLSNWQWTQKLVLHVRKHRQVKGFTPTNIVGYQQVEKQAEVVIDENAKKLKDKYHGKS